MKEYPICVKCGGEVISNDPPDCICEDCQEELNNRKNAIKVLRLENAKLRQELELLNRRVDNAISKRSSKN